LEKSSGIKALAQKHLSSGNLDKALAEYQKLLSLEDIDPYDYVLVGDVHLKKGATEIAVSLYSRAIDAYERLGLYKNAAAIGKRILRLDPSQSDMHRRLGDIRMRAGLAPEALQDFLAYHNMKMKEGDKAAAIEGLELACKADPSDTNISEKLVGLYEQTHRANLAAVELMRISEVVRSLGDDDAATRYAAKAVKLDASVIPPVSAAAHEPQSVLLDREPIGTLDSVPPAGPEAPPPTADSFVAATAAMEISLQPSGAETEPAHKDDGAPAQPAPPCDAGSPPAGTRQRPFSRPSTVNISQVLKQFKGQMESTLDPGDYQSHYDLGVTYKEMGLYEEALNEFRVASAGDDYRAKAFEMAGLCHLEMEEFEEAVEAFRRALRERSKEDEEYPGLCFSLAKALEGIGQKEEAVRFYTEVAALNPQFPGLRDRLAANDAQNGEVDA
jgi:tetratricopeptide (TPR) repeat protein